MQSKKLGFTAAVSFALRAGLLSWLAAFALPATAAGKSISLLVTPATLTSATTTVSALITNTGNSNANSFELDWTTSPYFSVTGASANGTAGSCDSTAGKCVFLKQIPTKTAVTVTLNVQVNNQCTPLSINWFAYAWTGSPGSVSQSFTLPPGPYVTSSSPNCSIQFMTQPTDAFVASQITGTPLNSAGAPVSVQLQRDGAGAPAVAVSVSASPPSCATTTGSATLTTNASGTVNLAYTGAAAGACVLTASATGYGSVSSQSFQVVPHGDLGCVESNNSFSTSGAGGLAFNGTRLNNVADPSPTAVGGSAAPACVVVPYVVSTSCPAGATGACINFVYDPLDQGTHMAFAFHWVWPVEDIPLLGIEAIANTVQLFLNGSLVALELDLCPEISPLFDTNGTLVGLTATSAPPADADNAVAGTQAGCLVRRTVKQVGNRIQLTEDAYVQGDYTATRR